MRARRSGGGPGDPRRAATYLADLVEHLEHFAVTVLPPDGHDHITLGQEPDGSLLIDLDTRLPVSHRSSRVDLSIFERRRPIESDHWELVDYVGAHSIGTT